jgi:protein O-mannosyl-transferase
MNPPLRRPGAVHVAVTVLLAVVVLATYANTFAVGFIVDSRPIIQGAPQVHAFTAHNIKLILTHGYWWPTAMAEPYRPLTTFSFLVNYAVLGNGERPSGYHWVNLGLHWGNALLVYLLMLRLGGALLAAVFAAALFAVHPIATEAVTNLVGRADLLAAASVFGGLLLHIRCQTATRKFWWRLALLLTATAGVFSKENAVVLLGVVGLYDVLFRLGTGEAASLRRTVLRIGQFAIRDWSVLVPPLALLWGMRRWIANVELPPEQFSENILNMADFVTARLTAIRVIGQELWQLLWPAKLCWDYSVDETRLFGWDLGHWPDQQAVIALVVLLGAVALAVALWRRAPAFVFCLAFFFITLLPTSNLILLIYSVRADRFLYLPAAGAAGCVTLAASGAVDALRRWRARSGHRQPLWPPVLVYTFLGAGALALAARAHVRNRDWQDELALARHDAHSCPNSFRTHKGLAAALYIRDRQTNIDEAIAEAEAAQAILDRTASPSQPPQSGVLEDLGLYYQAKAGLVAQPERRSWYLKAVGALERAATAQQALDAVHRQLRERAGQRAEEIPEFGNGTLYSMLGEAYLRLDDPHKAVEALVHAVRLTPADAGIYAALGSAYTAVGENQNAILSLLQAFLCDKTRQDVWPRLYKLYQQVDPNNCAFVLTAGQYQFNHDCPIVHRDICAALARQADAFAAAGEPDGVRDMREVAATQHGCAPAE